MLMKFALGLLAVAAVLAMAGTVTAAPVPKDDKKGNPVVVIDTNLGSFEVELYEDKAPITVKNFLDYVDEKYYDGLIFHRVIPTFMVQGGGFEPGMKQKKTKDPIKNEADNGLKNDKYTVAMARTNRADSATSQFFVNVKDNNFLNKGDDQAVSPDGYCVFGKVVPGTEVVDKIKDVKTGTADGFANVPTDDVVIKSVSRKKAK